MDYEKKYKEALERANECLKDGTITSNSINVITEIFPELKESEDERIKKIIKKCLSLYNRGIIESSLNAIDYTDCISWLEKQGEQKPVFRMKTPEERLGIDSETYNKIVDECIYGEQKPVEEVNGEDYGIDGLYAAMDILNKTLGQVEGYQSDDGILSHKAAMTAVKKLYKQSAAEWSEEDETTKNNISHIIRQYDKISKRESKPCHYVGDCLLWMQNIKDRVQPQPKIEWTLTDKNLMSAAIAFVEQNNSFNCWAGVTKDGVLAFLRSLRPQKQWKPSKEQMKALNKVREILHSEELWNKANPIMILYESLIRELEQLKAL